MKPKKEFPISVRVSESYKVRVKAYMLKHDCSEGEVVRRAINRFIKTHANKPLISKVCKGKKDFNLRTLVTQDVKFKIQAYMIKHKCKEVEVIRQATKFFLQSNVSSARQLILNNKEY